MCIICTNEYDVKTTELDISECNTIKELPNLPNLRMLDCYECTSLLKISNLPNLTELNCWDCTSLTQITNCPKLTILHCWKCTSLTQLHGSNKLRNLLCSDCTSLTEIPIAHLYLDCGNCPWLPEQNDEYKNNIEKLVRLQGWCKKNFKYWVFKRWIRSREFAEFFYSPRQFGGLHSKKQIKTLFNH